MLRAIHLAIDAPGGESVRGYDRIETPGIFFEKLVTKNAIKSKIVYRVSS
jgi:hypothetical protein